ncbi:MAG: CDP-diacylglycerol--serine O-phosphatidyltransferase [Syntrophaceae bacterium CG2_30_49_12]|nr:MAG: CDP-diacylglycerol--serine O-phosphatidyltransferase [Syntrophaceae bacterium CG2_30_49_12]PIP07610.1 MAG: CDP-diacylglycerol--serine O-phosphatidyltransferase [Syntrophobacterales bacterium CG23_combo_of_CG06-09_8_20_14_all_48_27]PJA49418.1 MAG: CDP-diacylglycerol--serine O-phosphatidyltransferase [Syntrophobacterales bacterium CG_4_9_14_3_um_filter_49_8]PJC77100.1 MAG: CDP-diacylglycerol--serine O-phosphatidyltransferase [Syntrophobacterales bacterium CG_4_8_14_3_um_filter_49_14]
MKNNTSSKKTGMKKGVYVLPNLLTTASLYCGFYSVIASLKGDFSLAAVAILISLVLDALDGRIARMTNTLSRFGAEYDSLSDLVAFGVAPAILAYTWALSSYGKWGWLAAFLFVVCGALRLARFNVQINIIESKIFNGLPIPGAAAVVATGILLFSYLGGTGRFNHLSALITIVALSLLMVSNIKYYSFKDLNFFSRKPFMSFVLMVLILIIVAAEPQIMIFTFSFGYSLSGPTWALVKSAKKTLVRIKNGRTEKAENSEGTFV